MPMIRQDGGIAGNSISSYFPTWASLPEGHSDLHRVNEGAGLEGEMNEGHPDHDSADSTWSHEGTVNGRSVFSNSRGEKYYAQPNSGIVTKGQFSQSAIPGPSQTRVV